MRSEHRVAEAKIAGNTDSPWISRRYLSGAVPAPAKRRRGNRDTPYRGARESILNRIRGTVQLDRPSFRIGRFGCGGRFLWSRLGGSLPLPALAGQAKRSSSWARGLRG